MFNTSFQPMLSHLFSNIVVKENIGQCKFNTNALTKCVTAEINQQFRKLHQQHQATCEENIITLSEIIEGETSTTKPYQIAIISYPDEMENTEQSIQSEHNLLLFFTMEKEKTSLQDYLETLDDYGAALKPHAVTIEGKPATIQILEQYYDFNVGTFNDYRWYKVTLIINN